MTESLIEWVDVETGEVSDTYVQGWQQIDKPAPEERSEAEWLPDYYLKKVLHIRAERAALRDKLEELAKRERALDWRYKARLEEIALEHARQLKKKKVVYDYGTVSFRHSVRVVVEDEEAAKAWAYKHRPEAIKINTTVKLLKSSLPTDEDVPGVSVKSSNNYKISYKV